MQPAFDDDLTQILHQRATRIRQLRGAIGAIVSACRLAREANPELADELLSLLVRLDEIQEELDRMDVSSASSVTGELYPFWVKLARGEPL